MFNSRKFCFLHGYLTINGHLRCEFFPYMEAEIIEQGSNRGGNSRTKSNSSRSSSRRKSSSRRGGGSSGKNQRKLEILKLLVFGVYGFLMFQSMMKMKSELLVVSLTYNALALVWLFVVRGLQSNLGKRKIKIAQMWLYCHICLLAIQTIILFTMGDEINPVENLSPQVQVEKAPVAPPAKYQVGDDAGIE